MLLEGRKMRCKFWLIFVFILVISVSLVYAQCTDSDAYLGSPSSKQIFEKGTACLDDNCETDYCVSSTIVREHYCTGFVDSFNVDCPCGYICQDGACVSNPIEVSSCNQPNEYMDCSGATYILVQDVGSKTDYCFKINAPDITLDCRGHSINNGGIIISWSQGENIINNVTIKNCILNNAGISLTQTGFGSYVYGNYIINNTIINNEIFLYYSDGNEITNNTLNYGGVSVSLSGNNLIQGNNISNCGTGINIKSSGIISSSRNIVRDNLIRDCSEIGIRVDDDSPANVIYNNLLKNNRINAFDYNYPSSSNYWYCYNLPDCNSGRRNIVNGLYIGGNYWSDYKEQLVRREVISQDAEIPCSPTTGFGVYPYEIQSPPGSEDVFDTKPLCMPEPGGPCQSDADCAKDEFCEFPDGVCSPPGTCVKIPDLCPGVYNPVCGCDSKTYSNDCYRRSNRMSKLYDGECTTIEEIRLENPVWTNMLGMEISRVRFDSNVNLRVNGFPPNIEVNFSIYKKRGWLGGIFFPDILVYSTIGEVSPTGDAIVSWTTPTSYDETYYFEVFSLAKPEVFVKSPDLEIICSCDDYGDIECNTCFLDAPPLRCDDTGQYENNCQACGCPEPQEEFMCEADGSCTYVGPVVDPCNAIDTCENYTDPMSCNQDDCSVAFSTIEADPLIPAGFCGSDSYYYNDTCNYTNINCSCAWTEDNILGICEGVLSYGLSCTTGPVVIIGSCDYSSQIISSCTQPPENIIEMQVSKVWNGPNPNPVCTGSYAIRRSCISSAELDFFSTVSLIIAVLIIISFYWFVLRKKKTVRKTKEK
jgi:parallel beta-helix repeat protein